MRPIIAIITIIGVINSLQLFAFAQGTENFEKRYEDSLTTNQRRSFSEDQQLERRFGILAGIKGLFKVGKAIGTAVYNRKHHRRSYDESLEQRDQLLERRELEKRFGILAGIKGLFKVGKAIGTAIYNRKHHNRRSYDELLEERDQLLELRDHLHGAHSYLAKRSNYDSLANDIVKRLVIQKRGVDYLLDLNARDLVERDVDVSISDLD